MEAPDRHTQNEDQRLVAEHHCHIVDLAVGETAKTGRDTAVIMIIRSNEPIEFKTLAPNDISAIYGENRFERRRIEKGLRKIASGEVLVVVERDVPNYARFYFMPIRENLH
jgi:hypothetical protein